MLGKGWKIWEFCSSTRRKNETMQLWVYSFGGWRPLAGQRFPGRIHPFRLKDRRPTSCGLGSAIDPSEHLSRVCQLKVEDNFPFLGRPLRALQFRRNGAHLLCISLGGCVSKCQSASKDLERIWVLKELEKIISSASNSIYEIVICIGVWFRLNLTNYNKP